MHLRSTTIWYWPYRLRSREKLNAVTPRREIEGVLLRGAEGGHACLQPWPELGDPPLQRCLDDLAGARSRSIVRRAMRCLEMDGAARSVEDPLFEDLDVPRSHATLASWDEGRIAAAREAGFDTVKLKCSADFDPQRFTALAAEHPALKWRLDFNETGEAETLAERLSSLAPEIRTRIDFIEDPCPYSPKVWKNLRLRTGIALAVDREAAPLSDAAQVMVIKPAIDEPWLLGEAALNHGQRALVTSYMDHPFGQAFAAWEAGRLALQFPALPVAGGLQTHHLFEPDAFTEALGPWSPAFQPPPGHGLGFDDLLGKLPWKRL